ncbi:MAG: penicillin acylase family protein, partial [Bacteroidota bacterium]
FIILGLIALYSCTSDSNERKVSIQGIEQPVEIIRDQWGINHIYAQNQHDLFFAQGYAAAKDRLFQFEIWRRQATGTVAEILGPRELKRDIGTRLFMYRGDMKEELNYYHDEGEAIIQDYVDGVNAYIDEAVASGNLPLEFELLGIVPQKWTPEVVISRHQGLLGNITEELDIGRAVAKVGAEKVSALKWFHPREPIIELDPAIEGNLLEADILELYNAYRKPVKFLKEDLVQGDDRLADLNSLTKKNEFQLNDNYSIGSNNWVVTGDKTASGYTIMANDPHRTIAVPSLRYMAHLVAPGWNVIGGGEPEIPGISIGHNEYGAWGLTVFRTDGEDLYVYELNPENLNQYKYKDQWEDMNVISEIIPVKGETDHQVDLRYTRHGPVTYIDSANQIAYAVRCAWLEPGGSPYLASLRMDQAQTWEEFRDACSYSNIPGENMAWAGKDGTIGWQAVGIAPVRRNFSGLVPVPGDGRYEWDGYLPIPDKPHMVNPDNGFIATANQNVTYEDYEYWDAIGYSWSDPYRGERVNEVLSSGSPLTMDQMKSLQTDYFSVPARTLLPYLQELVFEDKFSQDAQELLNNWDFMLEAKSVPAAIYVAWENELRKVAHNKFVPDQVDGLISLQLKRVIEWIEQPETMFKTEENRDQFLGFTFQRALANLRERLGTDMSLWQYGQVYNKHILIKHALGDIVADSLKVALNLGPLPRGGNAYTPGSTSSNMNQRSGGSFRIIVDTGDWDAAVGTNTPGQSGNPNSYFYDNLFESWARDDYFPIYFSKDSIEQVSVDVIRLVPQGKH